MIRGGKDYFRVGNIFRTGIFLHLDHKIAEKISPKPDGTILHTLTEEEVEETVSGLGPFKACRTFFHTTNYTTEKQSSSFETFVEALRYCNQTMDGTIAEIFPNKGFLPIAVVDAK